MQEELPISLRVSCDPAEVEKVLVRFLRDYAATSGRRSYVVGLSGGLDSAVSAALAARALGPDRVHPLVLPENSTPRHDLEDAALVARHLGLVTETISIQPLVDGFAATVRGADRAQIGNAKARFRMVLLHAHAAQRGGLVLGTGNKSEILTGYFSKYGDGGVDLQPLGDLYKTQVRQLAQHLGLPDGVILKAPTAGLWQGQTDEKELGITYDNLDRILLGLEIKLAPQTIAEVVGTSVSEVERIERLRASTQHKRHMPLIPKVGLRNAGLDWRSAVLEG